MTSPPISIGALCELLKTDVPTGVGDRMIHDLSTLDKAEAEHVSFVMKENLVDAAGSSRAGLLVARRGMMVNHRAVCHVDDVMGAVITLIGVFHPEPPAESFIHPTAVVADGVLLGEEVWIGPHCVLERGVRIGRGTRVEAQCHVGEEAELGEDCRLFPRVTVLERSRVGNRVRIHSGAVLGADGFRYEMADGKLRKVPQVGVVVVEDDVEIGANATIDRAFLTETRIGARTKIDNLVHVGHNVTVGSDSILVAQVGIAGSVKLGRGVVIGGQSGVSDHVTVGDGSRIGGQSGVHRDLPAGSEVIGAPVVDAKTYARFSQFYRDFSRHWKKLKPLLDEEDRTENGE